MSFKRAKSTENHQEAVQARNRNSVAILNELMKDTALVRHRKTLDDIAKAMTRAIENDQKWSVRCQKLQSDLDANELKVKTAIRLSEEDKIVIDTLKEELQSAWSLVEELKLQKVETFEDFKPVGSCEEDSAKCKESSTTNVSESSEMLDKLKEDKYKLLDEVEKVKLQIFELEEEMANKERTVDELTCTLKSKAACLEEAKKQNEKLKVLLDEKATCLEEAKKQNKKLKVLLDENGKPIYTKEIAEKSISSCSKLNSKAVSPSVSNENFILLKKELQDFRKKDQLSMEKLKLLTKRNKILTRQLQKTKNQINLLKVQLTGQTRMLDLLSCQYCKLEDKDRKQARSINELENVRNKYVRIIGSLEQEVHKLKKIIWSIDLTSA